MVEQVGSCDVVRCIYLDVDRGGVMIFGELVFLDPKTYLNSRLI